MKKFRPIKPISWYDEKRKWLSTTDIKRVLDQYQEAYPDSWFLGVPSSDFLHTFKNMCIGKELCDFSVKKCLEMGKRQIFMIVNLDTYQQPGSHWVAIYANFDPKMKKFGICYYDSTTYPPPTESVKDIRKFLKQVQNEANSIFKTDNFKIRLNTIQNQNKGTECGMFSLVFIILCIENQNESYFKTCHRIRKNSDDYIAKMRDILYLPVKKFVK